jgi:hypothetical protein
MYGTCNDTFHDERFVHLLEYFPKHLQCGCFLLLLLLLLYSYCLFATMFLKI